MSTVEEESHVCAPLTLELDTTDTAHWAGGVAFSGEKPKYSNAKIGFDGSNPPDNDISDSEDNLVWEPSFGSTSTTVSHDHAGNLIDDGTFRYVYDAWNRLVKVQASVDNGAVTYQTSEFDALGRKIYEVVDVSGDLNGNTIFLYNGQQIIETRWSSGTVVQQFIHGTQYIDELVMMRRRDKGDLYIHQDANWNVIGVTDLGHHLVERSTYTPYGELTVDQETGYGDRDGDGDVDSTDKGTVGTTCTGTVSGSCRILDLDFDGDYDSTDATKFDALTQGAMRSPGRRLSAVEQPFAHQGLLFEPEIASYQNRARQYDPGKRRFAQRDPLDAIVGKSWAEPAWYEYQKSDAVHHTDPLGLRSILPRDIINEAVTCPWEVTSVAFTYFNAEQITSYSGSPPSPCPQFEGCPLQQEVVVWAPQGGPQYSSSNNWPRCGCSNQGVHFFHNIHISTWTTKDLEGRVCNYGNCHEQVVNLGRIRTKIDTTHVEADVVAWCICQWGQCGAPCIPRCR